MLLRASLALMGFAAVLTAQETASERNDWPLRVEQRADTGQTQSWQALGPLFFSQPQATGGYAEGFRPLYLYRQNAAGPDREYDFLYPFFVYRVTPAGYRWSVLNLINRQAPLSPEANDRARNFDLWPFYFSRQTGDPATSYRAVWPIAGTVKHRLGQDRISWTLFPFYAESRRGAGVVRAMPWPFFKTFSGGGRDGVYLWPLVGWQTQAGASRSSFFLWPFVYRSETRLNTPTPTCNFGVLPFYASDRSAEATSRTFLWPFFGYTRRTAPYRYHEDRYFWPFLLQARGDDRYRNRWAPFFSHSLIKGYDKTWVCWPFWRQDHWTESGLAQSKTQLLYFVYHSTRQRSAAHPEKPAASKTHLWPLYSTWDNGAGRRQIQALSPFEVFFPKNDPVRLGYSPLFALYRFNQAAPGESRYSFLWNAISYERRTATAASAFHLGPLLSVEKRADTGGRVAIGHGLFGWRRAPGKTGWRPFLFDFARRAQLSNPPAK